MTSLPTKRTGLSWKRLSIRIKLLIPVLVAFAVALVILVWRVPPPINTLVEGDVRGVFTTRLGELRTPLSQFLDSGQKDVRQLADNPDVTSFFAARLSTDPSELTDAEAALASDFVGKITDGQLPYDSIRLVTLDGKQVALASARLIGDSISGVSAPVNKLGTEDITETLSALSKLADDGAYILPPHLSNPDKSSGLKPEPLIEMAVPLLYQSKLTGIIISSFRTRSILVDTFRQVGRNVTYQSLLADQRGHVLALTNSAVPDGVSVLGDPAVTAIEASLPLNTLDGNTQNLQISNGRVYTALWMAKQGSSLDSRLLFIVRDDLNTVYAGAYDLEATLFLIFSVVFMIAIIGIAAISQSVIRPLIEVSRVADRITAGDLDAKAPTTSEDEVGMVAQALNTMSSRLLDLIRTLEVRVQERTRNIEIAAEISQDTTQLSSLHDLLQRTVNVIQQRFDLYHVQIFLADDEYKYAVLTVGSGAIAEQLIAAEHRLEIGSQSVVGQSVERGEPVIILDTQNSARHRFNPLLPLTRAEMASPLRLGDKTIGVLDLQSTEVNAFGGESVGIFQMMADQIAIAVTNARLFEQSEEARRIADEANRQKSEFVSNMSHELRTPLNVIIGYSHSILNRPAMYENIPLPETYSPAMQSILVSGQHLLGLINDILDLSKIEAGRIDLDIHPIHAWPIMEGVRTTTIGLIKSDVKLRADYAADLPLIMADELRFRQILLNLVSNAAKFTDQGFITIDARVKDNQIVFSVADTGSGIPEESKALIFGRFRQASPDVAKKVGGTGLGLNISRQLTMMQGGDIWFESEPSKGTTFYFTMPLAPAQEQNTDSSLRSPLKSIISTAQSHIFDPDENDIALYQILIVDTNSATRAGLESALSQPEYTVLSTDNYERALHIATTLLPDVVIILLHMKDSDTLRLLPTQLREDKDLANAHIIVFNEDSMTTPTTADLYRLALEQVQTRLTVASAS